MGEAGLNQPQTLFSHPETENVAAPAKGDALRHAQGLDLVAAMPSLSITGVKTYPKSAIGCFVFQHKREDVYPGPLPPSSIITTCRRHALAWDGKRAMQALLRVEPTGLLTITRPDQTSQSRRDNVS